MVEKGKKLRKKERRRAGRTETVTFTAVEFPSLLRGSSEQDEDLKACPGLGWGCLGTERLYQLHGRTKAPPILLSATKDERVSPAGWHRLQVTTAT